MYLKIGSSVSPSFAPICTKRHSKKQPLLLGKRNKKYVCRCGGKYTYANKCQHEKSNKHSQYINNSKTLVNNGTLNINITVNNPEDLAKILKTINK
jgi:hypothetical protein